MDSPGGPGRVCVPFWRSGTGPGTFREVWDGLGDPPGGLRRVRGPYQRSGSGRETIPVVRVGSGALPEVRNRSETPRTYGTCRSTLPAVWNGSVHPPRVLGWVEGPSLRSGMGRGTIPEVRDGSGDPFGGLK